MEIKDIISSGLLELYAMGMTSPEENVQVEQWLDMYPEVVAELDNIQAGMEEYANAHAIQPSPGLKEKIMSQIDFSKSNEAPVQQLYPSNNNQSPNTISTKQKQRAAVYTLNSYFKWAAAACFVLLLGSLALTYNYYNKYSVAQNELQQQKLEASNMNQQLGVVTDKYAVPVSLKGTEHSPEASARIFWMKNTGDVYVAPGALPAAPAGKQYQLWAIVEGKPVSGGMISKKTGEAYRLQKMTSFGKAEAFAITLEKEGGSPTPTMDEMYVMSKI